MNMYTFMNKRNWLVALMGAALALSSCSKEDLVSEQEAIQNSEYKIVEGTGERVTLEISGETDLGDFGAAADGLRYKLSTDFDNLAAVPVINLDEQVGKGKARKLLVRLVEKSEPSKITELIVGADKLEFAGTQGQYTFKLNVEVNLQEGQSFATGEWYISGVYGSTNTNPSVFTHNPTDAKFFTIGTNTVEMPGVSLVIPWTRIYTKAQPSIDDTDKSLDKGVGATAMGQLGPKLGRNFGLKLKPDGVMLRVRPVSNILDNVLITTIRMRTQELVMGTHTYEKPTTVDLADLTGGAYPAVTSVSSTSDADLEVMDKYQGVATHAQGYIVPAGDYGRLEMFVWGFPKAGVETDESKRTAIWVVSQGFRTTRWNSQTKVVDDKTSDGTIEPRAAEDVKFFTNNTNQGIQAQYISERWGQRQLYQKVKKQAFKRGNLYLLLPRVESDLQITERYSHVQDAATGTRYGVIEIYNPTLREIDLNEYGLARVALTGYDNATVPTLGDFLRNTQPSATDAGRFTNINIGEMYAFPVVTEPYHNPAVTKEASFTKNTPLPDANASRLASALVLPLTGKYSSASVGMYINGSAAMYPSPTHAEAPKTVVTGSTDKSDYPARYTDYTTALGGAQAYDTSGGRPNILAPGQTMIILTNGYLNSASFTDVASNKNASNIPTFFADIKKAVDMGYCKYVVAMNNAKSEAAAPLSADAGVMTLGSYDIPLLLKRKTTTGTGFYYQLIDGLWSNRPLGAYFGYGSGGKNSDEIYAVQLAANKEYGIISQYIKAKNRTNAGLWEKRTPSHLFNSPVITEYSTGRMTAAQDYSVDDADNFTNFGVRLFEEQRTARNPQNYVVKWRTTKAQQ